MLVPEFLTKFYARQTELNGIIALNLNKVLGRVHNTVDEIVAYSGGRNQVMLQDGISYSFDPYSQAPADYVYVLPATGKRGGRWLRKLGQYINVKDYGAVGNGVSDDTSAFQAAIDAAKNLGVNTVLVPKGQWVITGNVRVRAGVTLMGQPKLPFKAAFNLDFALLVIKYKAGVNNPSIFDAFTLEVASAMKGFCFYWPDQKKDSPTPIEYGWAITTTAEASQGDNIQLEDIMLTNCYNGINVDFGGQWLVRNIFGQTFNIGIRLDRVYDVARLEKVHFWDFWAGGADAAKAYIQTHGKAIVIGKVDGLQATNLFSWGHKHLLHFTDFGSGGAWAQLTNVKSDINEIPIKIDKANLIQITQLNGTGLNPSTGYGIIETGTDVGGEVNIVNMSFFYSMHGAVISSNTGVFKFTNIIGRNRDVDGSDIAGYKILNQGSAKVFIDEAQYREVSGTVQVGGNVKWTSDVDVTSSFPNFANLLQWTNVNNRVSAITNGFRFLLTGGVDVHRILVPDAIAQQAGVFIIECDIVLNNPSNIGPAQFYLRLTNNEINDVILPATAVNGFYTVKRHIKVPFIIRKKGFALDFVFGNASGNCSLDITNIKLYKMSSPSQATIDWLQNKFPNSLNLLLPVNLKPDKVITARDFGAKGDGIADDSAAIQAAVDFAIQIGSSVINFSNGNYKVTQSITLDYRGKGQLYSYSGSGSRGVQFKGENSRIFISGEFNSFYAFNILTDVAPQQDTFVQFRDLWFYTDNVNRPNAIKVSNACFVTVDNCVFMQPWIALRAELAGQIRVINSQFFGCGAGVSSYRCHDLMIIGSQAQACTFGYQITGINDHGSDGGVIIDNCEAVDCENGIDIDGVHAPIINNVFIDIIGAFGIRVQNCSWGKISNAWIGPAKGNAAGIYSIHFKHTAGHTRKDYWQLSNIKAEAECRFENAFALDINGLQTAMTQSSVSGGVVAFINCQEVKIDARVRDFGTIPYSLFLDGSCSNFDISGTYDKGLRLDGASRVGRHKFNLPKFLTEPVFEGGVKNEVGQYFFGEVPKTLKNGRGLPAVVMPQVVMTTVGQVINVDVTTLIPVPSTGEVYIATLLTSNGIFGSFGTTAIQVIRHVEQTKAVITSSIESSSVTVTLPDSTTIRFTCNANNAGTVAKLTLISLEKM